MYAKVSHETRQRKRAQTTCGDRTLFPLPTPDKDVLNVGRQNGQVKRTSFSVSLRARAAFSYLLSQPGFRGNGKTTATDQPLSILCYSASVAPETECFFASAGEAFSRYVRAGPCLFYPLCMRKSGETRGWVGRWAPLRSFPILLLEDRVRQFQGRNNGRFLTYKRGQCKTKCTPLHGQFTSWAAGRVGGGRGRWDGGCQEGEGWRLFGAGGRKTKCLKVLGGVNLFRWVARDFATISDYRQGVGRGRAGVKARGQ